MKKFGLIEKAIFGDTYQISSERYFVTISTLVASLFLLILCFAHICAGLKITPVILAGSSSILILGL